MPTKDLGTKHTCFKCGTKFYDMKKPAPICPKCGVDQREMPVPTKAASRKAAAARLEAAEEPEEVLEESEEAEEEEADEEEDDA